MKNLLFALFTGFSIGQYVIFDNKIFQILDADWEPKILRPFYFRVYLLPINKNTNYFFQWSCNWNKIY